MLRCIKTVTSTVMEFNVGDLVFMNRYILGTYTFNEKQFKSADLNGDGNADVFDVIEFRRKILAD